MIKMHRATDKQLAWMNKLGGTEYDVIYQVSDGDSEEGYTTFAHDAKTNHWMLFMQDRVWESSSEMFLRGIAYANGYVICG